jgi:cytochrome c oxidase cbb3-type subunit 2
MPAYRYLYEKRRISGEVAHDALKLVGEEAPEEGWEIVPTYDARCLVAFLMSRDQSHPLKEVKASTAVAPAAAASPAASPAPAPGKEAAK